MRRRHQPGAQPGRADVVGFLHHQLAALVITAERHGEGEAQQQRQHQQGGGQHLAFILGPALTTKAAVITEAQFGGDEEQRQQHRRNGGQRHQIDQARQIRDQPRPFRSSSRISASSASDGVGPGGSAGASAGLAIALLAAFTIRKITKAMMTKLMKAVTNLP